VAVVQYKFAHKKYIEQNKQTIHRTAHYVKKQYIEKHNSQIRKIADRAQFL